MTNIADISFHVTVHFQNGVTIEKQVPLSKAYKLSSKSNVIIPTDTEIVEIKGVNGSIVIPVNMTFVVNISPDFRHVDSVSRYMLYTRAHGRCAYCGKELKKTEATIDHIIPVSQGGETSWENIALSCSKCNCKKDNRNPKQANMPLLITPYNPKRGGNRNEKRRR